LNVVFAIVVGTLYATGLFLMLRRSIVNLILGLALLSHAANLLIFAAAELRRAPAPLVPAGAQTLAPPFADPLPQALILTAIVIGFGVLAFALVLVHRTYEATGTDDGDQIVETTP
jgi:multicomponent Na+:H+ antiporter subunit C